MFEVGKTYQRQDGVDVTIIAEMDVGGPYHAVQGNGISAISGVGIWRYARPHDAGRVTASAFDMSDPRNLVPPTEEARKYVAETTAQFIESRRALGVDPSKKPTLKAEIRNIDPGCGYQPIYVGERCVALGVGGMALSNSDLQKIAAVSLSRGLDYCMPPEEVETLIFGPETSAA